MRRAVIAALALVLLAPSAWADVIPSRRPDADASADRQAVSVRLQEFGLTAREAATHVSALLDEEARYFAGSPARTQVVGLDDEEPGVSFGEKILLGTLMLGATFVGLREALWTNHR